MSAKDLSILSYKELQALAVKHRVPGNIKKLLLVKILHAVKCGNSLEVTRLLTDLKKNRKKRTKRMKIMKADEDGSIQIALQNDSPDLTQQDHYLFPIQQQQYPFQWVGAEEEVGTSKYEDLRCSLSYNDIRQLVLYTSHGVYGNCDTNNNSTLLDEIMDLRTETTVSNYHSNMDITHINTTSQQHQNVRPTVDECTSKMSVLLKKMLQAPVGANLGEIASPVESWSMDTYRIREHSPDNSETMTAKSDINENDEIWQDNMTVPVTGLSYVFENDQSYCDNSYYRRDSNMTTYYKPTLDSTGEQNSLQDFEQQHLQQQICNPYQFNFVTQTDAQENCRSWLAANSLDISNPTDYESTSITRLEPTSSLQFQSPENGDIINASLEDTSIIQTNDQFCMSTDQLYPMQGSTSILGASELITNLQLDTSRYYQTTSNMLKLPEPHDYYKEVCATADGTSYIQELYETHHQPQQQHLQINTQQPQHQQDHSNDQNHQSHHSDYTQQLSAAVMPNPLNQVELDNSTYDSRYYQDSQQNVLCNQSTAIPIGTNQLQQVQKHQFENYVSTSESTIIQNNLPTTFGSAVLNPYWPRWSHTDRNSTTTTMSGRTLENTLNLCTTNYVDYTKLNETCCVYSNKTPVMTLRKGFNSVPSTLENQNAVNGSNSTEYRQHNFVSNWLLYNESNSNMNTKTKNFVKSTSTRFYSVDQRSDII